jgi:hypothetical protein
VDQHRFIYFQGQQYYYLPAICMESQYRQRLLEVVWVDRPYHSFLKPPRMKGTIMIRRIATAIGVGVASLAITSTPAIAARPHWDNTFAARNSVTVGWCAGGTGTVPSDDGTGKNVCRVLHVHDKWLYVISSRGTTLIRKSLNCGDSRWITLNTRTDTSGTAEVYTYYNQVDRTGRGCV